MLYNIHISQIALNDLGIDNLDYNDLAIFNAIEYMHTSNKITKQVIESVQYSLINWKLIKKQLPFLQHNTKQTIKKRIKKLELAGLIEICPLNQELHSPYYRMGKNYDDYKVKKERPYTKDEHPISNNIECYIEKDIGAISKKITNNSIINNNIKYNNNIYVFDDFYELIWKTYKTINNSGKAEGKEKAKKLNEENLIKLYESVLQYKDYSQFEGYKHCLIATFINKKRYLDDWSEVNDDDDNFFNGSQTKVLE